MYLYKSYYYKTKCTGMSVHDSVQMFSDLTNVNVNILLYMLNLCQKKEKKKEREREREERSTKRYLSSHSKSNNLPNTEMYF